MSIQNREDTNRCILCFESPNSDNNLTLIRNCKKCEVYTCTDCGQLKNCVQCNEENGTNGRDWKSEYHKELKKSEEQDNQESAIEVQHRENRIFYEEEEKNFNDDIIELESLLQVEREREELETVLEFIRMQEAIEAIEMEELAKVLEIIHIREMEEMRKNERNENI